MVFSAVPRFFPNPRNVILTEAFKRLLGVGEDDEIPPPLFIGLDALPLTFRLPGLDLETTRFFIEQFPVIQRLSEGPPSVPTGYRTPTGDVAINLVSARAPNRQANPATTTTTQEEDEGPTAGGTDTDYAAMSVRKLKRVLAVRGVSCVGMVEKAELVAACRESGAR